MSKYGTNGSGIFLSTPSARRATSFSMRLRLPTRNFYPRPPRGGRHDLRAGQGPRSEISIHALREEGDRIRHGPAGREVYFYPRPPRGGRRLRPAPEHACGLISIHALREEGDGLTAAHKRAFTHFYPRPPRGGRRCCRPPARGLSPHFYPRPPRGGRLPVLEIRSSDAQFLSTPSARRATYRRVPHGHPTQDFYPRPPRGGRPFPGLPAPAVPNFYPRPPRGGRHLESVMLEQTDIDFYPRPPRGGRLCGLRGRAAAGRISIHALREEGDRDFPQYDVLQTISIHALREEGDLWSRAIVSRPDKISIHALREEGDQRRMLPVRSEDHFYPRPPRGGRRGSR